MDPGVSGRHPDLVISPGHPRLPLDQAASAAGTGSTRSTSRQRMSDGAGIPLFSGGLCATRSREATIAARGFCCEISYCKVERRYASAKPSTVARPTGRPPSFRAWGIITSTSIVSTAPPANASISATVLSLAPLSRP
jgi:hypothetical protein